MKTLLSALLLSAAAFGTFAEAPVRVVLYPARTAVLSSLVDTRISRVALPEGTAFEKDAELVFLEELPFKLRFDRARAALDEAESATRFAEKQNVRIAELYAKHGFQSKAELDRAEFDLEQARARENAAKTALELAQMDRENCAIKAPFAGRLFRKLAQEHEYVRVGQNLLHIIDDRKLLAVAHLDSSLRNKVNLGETRRVEVDETRTEHQGKIVEISAEVDTAGRTFAIKVELDNARALLAPGMSGTLAEEPKP